MTAEEKSSLSSEVLSEHSPEHSPEDPLDNLSEKNKPQNIYQKLSRQLFQLGQQHPDWSYIFSLWLGTRLLILVIMLAIAPLLPVPPNVPPVYGDWSVFAAWDSDFYREIAQKGYRFAADGKQHNSIAFFPLYPLLAKALIMVGIKFRVGAVLINNAAFFGTIVALYYWMKSQYSAKAARWVTAVLALCPLSLYGTVIYTEGLFLFVSTLSLWSFEQRNYLGTGFWGALATATRPTGVALIPALLLASFKEKRGLGAIAASISTAAGIGAFSLYCWWQFKEPLAFFIAQRSWRPELGFDRNGWLHMFMEIIVGWDNWKNFAWVDPLHPIVFLGVCIAGITLWWNRRWFSETNLGYGYLALSFILWLLGGDAFINIAMSLGGAYLLWVMQPKLSLVVMTYGFCGLGLILSSGSTISVNRISYGIVALAIALGLWLSERPKWGYVILSWFGLVLATFALRFARNLWVA